MADAASWLVAHRGWPARYPENSLDGVRAVLEAGARWVEFDVQLTVDYQPVVIHDEQLNRLTGRDGRITALRLDELDDIRVSGGAHGRDARIERLETMLEVFTDFPGVVAFVELKHESILRLGRRRCVDAVLQRLSDAPCDCVFLSFDALAVGLARRRGAAATGWVFRPWTFVSRWCARVMRPDYLFIRVDRIPGIEYPFWAGRWQWVIYNVEDLPTARRLRERGATLIEVDDLPALLDAADGETGRR